MVVVVVSFVLVVVVFLSFFLFPSFFLTLFFKFALISMELSKANILIYFIFGHFLVPVRVNIFRNGWSP